MNLKNRTLSMEIEYDQEIRNNNNKKKLKAFQKFVTIFKINFVDFRFFLFMCWASRICCYSLSILCTIELYSDFF